jgi:hypothetical protein
MLGTLGPHWDNNVNNARDAMSASIASITSMPRAYRYIDALMEGLRESLHVQLRILS